MKILPDPPTVLVSASAALWSPYGLGNVSLVSPWIWSLPLGISPAVASLWRPTQMFMLVAEGLGFLPRACWPSWSFWFRPICSRLRFFGPKISPFVPPWVCPLLLGVSQEVPFGAPHQCSCWWRSGWGSCRRSCWTPRSSWFRPAWPHCGSLALRFPLRQLLGFGHSLLVSPQWWRPFGYLPVGDSQPQRGSDATSCPGILFRLGKIWRSPLALLS